jgi:hypothetical protein
MQDTEMLSIRGGGGVTNCLPSPLPTEWTRVGSSNQACMLPREEGGSFSQRGVL